MIMLLSSSMSFCQEDTSLNDSLIYTPQYLFEMMVADLEQCDLDRIELKKAKAELALIYVDLARHNGTITALKKDLQSMRTERDTLEAQNMQLAIDNTAALKKVKKSRNRWFATTIAATLGAIGVHYNWKESWVKP